jgi:hypothetical protein
MRALLIAALLVAGCKADSKPPSQAKPQQWVQSCTGWNRSPSCIKCDERRTDLFTAYFNADGGIRTKDEEEVFPSIYNAISKASDCEPGMVQPIQSAFKDGKITFGELRELARIEGAEAAKDADANTRLIYSTPRSACASASARSRRASWTVCATRTVICSPVYETATRPRPPQ